MQGTICQNAKAVYRRFREERRLMPDGMTFVGSRAAADLDRCFRLMEFDDVTLLQRWVAEWFDLIEFEIVPVVPGKNTAAALVPANVVRAHSGRPPPSRMG
jgi:hypothetical protein